MPAEAAPPPWCLGSICVDSTTLASPDNLQIIAGIIPTIALVLCYKWWKVQQQYANGGHLDMIKAIFVSVVAAISTIALLIACSWPVVVSFLLASAPPSATTTIAVESWPTPPPVACPEQGSPCRTPTLFARVEVTMRIRAGEDKSFMRDAKDYNQPDWMDVSNDLVRVQEYGREVRDQLGQSSFAVDERDKTFSHHMHRAQTAYERRKWSKSVGPVAASRHPPSDDTNSMIMCEFLDASVETQRHFLAHPALAGLERSLSGQLNATIKAHQTTKDTKHLSKSGYLTSANPRMRSVTDKLENAFHDRIAEDINHIKDFQTYLKLENQALTQFERRRDTVCKVALREQRGEIEEVPHYKLGPRVVTISDMTWIFGGLVRKAATHVSASAKTYPGPGEE